MPNLDIKFAHLDSNQEYTEAKSLIDARKTERAEFRKEAEALSAKMRELAAKGGTTPDSEAADRITALAQGKTHQSREDNQKRLGELTQKIRDLDSAVDYLDSKLRGIANVHSIAVCESLKKQHAALAVGIFDAVVAAYDAAKRCDDFLDTLRDSGINVCHFPQSVTPDFLEYKGKYGRMAHWLDGIAHDGLISRSKIPAELDFRK